MICLHVSIEFPCRPWHIYQCTLMINDPPTNTKREQLLSEGDNIQSEGDGGEGTSSALAVRRQELERLKAELQEMGRALSQNAQYVCRQLKENPRVSGYALKVERERQGLVHLLEAVIQELHESAGGFGETLCSKACVCA